MISKPATGWRWRRRSAGRRSRTRGGGWSPRWRTRSAGGAPAPPGAGSGRSRRSWWGSHVSQGAGKGLLLPFVMEFTRPKREAAFAQIGRLLTQGEHSATPAGPSEHESLTALADGAIREVAQLRRDIGIPTRLRDLG